MTIILEKTRAVFSQIPQLLHRWIQMITRKSSMYSYSQYGVFVNNRRSVGYSIADKFGFKIFVLFSLIAHDIQYTVSTF